MFLATEKEKFLAFTSDLKAVVFECKVRDANGVERTFHLTAPLDTRATVIEVEHT